MMPFPGTLSCRSTVSSGSTRGARISSLHTQWHKIFVVFGCDSAEFCPSPPISHPFLQHPYPNLLMPLFSPVPLPLLSPPIPPTPLPLSLIPAPCQALECSVGPVADADAVLVLVTPLHTHTHTEWHSLGSSHSTLLGTVGQAQRKQPRLGFGHWGQRCIICKRNARLDINCRTVWLIAKPM